MKRENLVAQYNHLAGAVYQYILQHPIWAKEGQIKAAEDMEIRHSDRGLCLVKYIEQGFVYVDTKSTSLQEVGWGDLPLENQLEIAEALDIGKVYYGEEYDDT